MSSITLNKMIQELDAAVKDNSSNKIICAAVKSTLEKFVRPESDLLPENFLEPTQGSYARRLLHRDKDGRYSVAVMVWDKDQGTPIHDHAGLWCVECVYKGVIKVDSYSLHGLPSDQIVSFSKENSVRAGCGEAGSLIPPFDYHIIENAQESPAVTIHVYGGDMDWCHAYQKMADGRYERQRKELSFGT